MASGEESQKLGLADFLRQVRNELLEGSREQGQKILELKNVELEVSFVVGKAAKGGVKFWIVEAGGEYSKQQTHTVKLTLIPIQDVPPPSVGGGGGGGDPGKGRLMYFRRPDDRET